MPLVRRRLSATEGPQIGPGSDTVADVGDALGTIVIRPIPPALHQLFFVHAALNRYEVEASWTSSTTLTVPAGRHQVAVWARWLTWARFGYASVVVSVAAGETIMVDWSAPAAVWNPGKLHVYRVSG